MKKIFIVVFTTLFFLLATNVLAGGGFSDKKLQITYRIDEITMDENTIEIYGWAYDFDGNVDYISKGEGSKQHNYQLYINGNAYQDIGDYHIDHTYLNSVIGITPTKFQNVGFHFSIEIDKIIDSKKTDFSVFLKLNHDNLGTHTIALSYLTTVESIKTKNHTLSMNTDKNPVSIYTTSDRLYVRNEPRKSSPIIKGVSGKDLYFSPGDIYSIESGTMTGKIAYDNETKSYWYQIRYKESYQDGNRMRVKADKDGKLAWICDSHVVYAGTPLLLTIESNNYQVEYIASEASNVPDTQYKQYDIDLELSSKIPNKEGYQFNHWITSENEIYEPSSIYKENISMVLYASWINEYPVIEGPILEEANTTSTIAPFLEDDKIIIQQDDKFNILEYIKVNDVEDGDITNKAYIEKSNLHENEDNELVQSGEYIVTVACIDSGGNIAYRDFNIVVNAPPILSTVDRYYLAGWNVDSSNLLQKATSVDKEDGDIKKNIVIEKIIYPSNVVEFPTVFETYSIKNDYTSSKIIYSVSDNHGMKVYSESYLHVYNDKGISNLLSIRFINSDYIDTIDKDSYWSGDDAMNELSTSFSRTKPLYEYYVDTSQLGRKYEISN